MGSVTFSNDSVTVEDADGKSHTLAIEKLRLITLDRDPARAAAEAAATRNGLRGRYYSNIIPSRHLFPLAPKKPLPKKFHHEVCLRSGSTLVGRITAADSRRIQLTTTDGPVTIPTPAVGYMKFAHSWGTDLAVLLKTKPPGVAYLNRDYAEGKFQSFSEGVATMESVLFGKQVIQQAELRAIKLAGRTTKPARMRAHTTGNHTLFLNSIESLSGGLVKVRDAGGYHLTIPAAQIRQVSVGRPSEE